VVELLLQGAEPFRPGHTPSSDDTGSEEALEQAVAMVARSYGVPAAQARARLLVAAERAGIGSGGLVRLVLEQASHR
jgi:hypothetical protein